MNIVERFLGSFLLGWLILAVENAIYAFVIPHDLQVANEIGPVERFLIFLFLESLFFTAAFTFVLIPLGSWLRSVSRSGALLSGALITVLFSVAMAVFSILAFGTNRANFLFVFSFAVLPGAAALFVYRHPLPRLTLRSRRSLRSLGRR
jgi:hypothetical protein